MFWVLDYLSHSFFAGCTAESIFGQFSTNLCKNISFIDIYNEVLDLAQNSIPAVDRLLQK